MRTVSAGLLLAAVHAVALPAQDSHLVVVRGISGDAGYRERFSQWSNALISAAQDRMGLPRDRIVYLSERDGDEGADGRATKAAVEQTLTDLAQSAGADDMVFVVLIGHGSGTGADSRFNLPGPDLTAADYNVLLDRFLTQRVVFVNTATASGDFVPVLSADNRIVITATKTSFERNEAVFGGHFVQAFAEDVADTDKDNRVSALEAFAYARREVQREYEEDGRLQTEHAILDDNGDGEGSDEPSADGGDGDGDGAQARWAFLAGSGAAAVGEDDPVLAQLYRDKAAIEQRLADLRSRREEMEAEAYDQALEDLLVELALKNREIQQRERGE